MPGSAQQEWAKSSLTEYADSQPDLAVPKAQSTRDCRLKEGPDGALIDAETGQPYELKTVSCVAIGAHVGHNAQATEAVRADVMAFLTATLLRSERRAGAPILAHRRNGGVPRWRGPQLKAVTAPLQLLQHVGVCHGRADPEAAFRILLKTRRSACEGDKRS